jgi:digeranylgeranylglycerophospholipid reductase
MYVHKQILDEYDVIVVGAGPAGSMAAWQAARKNVRVLLLEKDREVGTPVRCAEGVAKKDLEEIIEQAALPEWVASEISKFRIFSPDGTPVYVKIHEVGYVLNRRLFDYDLARRATSEGAQLLTHAEVVGVLRNGDHISGVKVRIAGEEKEIKARIVIAADGVESRVARWAGIDSTIKLKDMETCVQYTLCDIPIDSDTCDFYFSREFAPGGYAWIFPKGEKTANVGVGIAGNFARNHSPQEYFEIFIEKYFPEGSVISKTVGGVPVGKTLKDLVLGGFMVVGDAAHQTNPISGGGINSGLIAGKLAGSIAADAVKKGKYSKKDLLPYARQWDKQIGKSHERFYRLKEALVKFDDKHFNAIAADYLHLDPKNQNLLNLFKLAFKNNPAFLLDIIKLFSPF